jgi:prophage regulatory protein
MTRRKARLADSRGERVLLYKDLRDYGVVYSRSWIDRLERAGKFPRRIVLGTWHVGWLERVIVNYMRTVLAQEPSHQLGRLGSHGRIKARGRHRSPHDKVDAHPAVGSGNEDPDDRRHDQRLSGRDEP